MFGRPTVRYSLAIALAATPFLLASTNVAVAFHTHDDAGHHDSGQCDVCYHLTVGAKAIFIDPAPIVAVGRLFIETLRSTTDTAVDHHASYCVAPRAPPLG